MTHHRRNDTFYRVNDGIHIEKGGCTLMPGDGCSFVLRSFRSEVPHGVAHYVWTNQLFYNIQKSVV